MAVPIQKMLDFSGKTVIVTGGRAGLGSGIAKRFAETGANVVITYRTENPAHPAAEVVAEIEKRGAKGLAIRTDVRDAARSREMIAKAAEVFGRVDMLVNNAGIAQQKLFTDLTAADWDRMLSVNAGGVFHTCRCVLPGMLRRHSGRIVNISSIWGISGASCEVHYSASKAAVIGFTRALAQEVGPSGVTVNCVAPGVIDTEMNANLSPETLAALCGETPLCRIGSPEEVADAVVFLCGGKARFITGQVLKVDGGFLGG